MENGKLRNNKSPRRDASLEEDLQFILWKAELNKELLDFWKLITEDN
jgi:hypothetical protein